MDTKFEQTSTMTRALRTNYNAKDEEGKHQDHCEHEQQYEVSDLWLTPAACRTTTVKISINTSYLLHYFGNFRQSGPAPPMRL